MHNHRYTSNDYTTVLLEGTLFGSFPRPKGRGTMGEGSWTLVPSNSWPTNRYPRCSGRYDQMSRGIETTSSCDMLSLPYFNSMF